MRNQNLTAYLKFTVSLLCMCLWVMSLSGVVSAEYMRRESYDQYLATYKDAINPDHDVIIPGGEYWIAEEEVEVLHNPYGYEGDALLTGERGAVEWLVFVPEPGLYNVEVTYYPVTGRNTAIEREIQVNRQSLFDGADYLVLPRVFGDDGPFLKDAAGNEIRPRQVEKPQWQSIALGDSLGYHTEPYQFYFNAGFNTIKLIGRAEPVIIGHLRLYQKEAPRPYAEIAQDYDQSAVNSLKDVFVKIQGQDAVYRSSPALFAIFDQGDPTTEPYHPAEIRLNSIGGYRWQNVGEWIAWEVDVPKSGYYQIAIKGKQNVSRGLFSNRKLMIDGKVPFAEVDHVQFNFTNRYQMKVLGEDIQEEPFLFYLEEGKHEIRLEAVLGELASLIKLTEESLYELNTLYRSIIMITSAAPDPMRSYQLDKRVPQLLERLEHQSGLLRAMAAEFEGITGQKGGHTATLTDFARMLDRMVQRPDSIPNLLQEYRDAIGSLGTWVMNTRQQPLQIDYLVIASPEQKMPRATPTVFQTALHEVRAFVASFTHDYTSVRDITTIEDTVTYSDSDAIKVWIGLGRDQAQILKQMIEDTFTPETGIRVDLELISTMDQLLVPATIANTHPDVAIGAANMDMAFRGAVVDLSKFPDFPEVAQRFRKSALLTFRFRDQVFALPEVQSFPMLFYRKDILDELGLKVPQTWDDVYAILPDLQNNHLEFGMWPSIYTYVQFLYQQGIALYYEDVVEVNLASEAGVEAFTRMTNLFTQSGLPIQYNFINRFRMGEMPLAIANYSEYNTLTVFAPELRGEWAMAPIPGTLSPDGTINRAVPVAQDALRIQTDTTGAVIMPSGTTGSIILEKSKKHAEAWEFLKWWTRTDTQVRFGQEMEALIGPSARFATANVEAMQQLPWRVEERDQLNEQWDWVEGVPPVLGGYYVTRQFDWLFRAVVLQNEPIREAVLDYSREINREMARKREEFGLETELDQIDDSLKELYWDHYTHVYRLDRPAEAMDEQYRAFLERKGLLLEEGIE